MESGPAFAEKEIRVLLAGLGGDNHGTRIKAIKRFKDYISEYRPDANDEDVEYLFLGGEGNGRQRDGLLYYAGQDSVKHEGQLKRIAGPAIELIRWLISFDMTGQQQKIGSNLAPNYDSIFYDQFICFTLEQLTKVNFSKHILGGMNMNSRNFLGFGGAKDIRSGSAADALELMAVLTRDHRDIDGNFEEVDVSELLNYNQYCKDVLEQYLTSRDAEELSKTVAALREEREGQARVIDNRPSSWAALEPAYRVVPLQVGEDVQLIAEYRASQAQSQEQGEEGEEEGKQEAQKFIRDPLGLSDLDLLATQELHKAGKLTLNLYGNPSTVSAGKQSTFKTRGRAMSATGAGWSKDPSFPTGIPGVGAAGAAETNNSNSTLGQGALSIEASQGSVLPEDSSFRAELFLALIHGNTGFDRLKEGKRNLQDLIASHHDSRAALVRDNFGLIVQCADGLKWLKGSRVSGSLPGARFRSSSPGRARASSTQERSQAPAPIADRRGRTASLASITGGTTVVAASDGGAGADAIALGERDREVKLRLALDSLDRAKNEANSTLAPIMDRMRKAHRIKSAESVVKRLAPILDFPNRMSQAESSGRLDEALRIFRLVLSLNHDEGLSSQAASGTVSRVMEVDQRNDGNGAQRRVNAGTTGSEQITQGGGASAGVTLKVKHACLGVALDLRERCFRILFAPEPSFPIILRHAKVLRALDGRAAYREHLRQCLGHQVESIKGILQVLFRQYAEDLDEANRHAAALACERRRKMRALLCEVGVLLSERRGARDFSVETPLQLCRLVHAAGSNLCSELLEGKLSSNVKEALMQVDNMDNDTLPDQRATTDSSPGSSHLGSGDTRARRGHAKSVRFSDAGARESVLRGPTLSTLEVVKAALQIVSGGSGATTLTKPPSWRPTSRLHDPKLGTVPAMTIDLTGRTGGLTVEGHRNNAVLRSSSRTGEQHRHNFQRFGHVLRDHSSKNEGSDRNTFSFDPAMDDDSAVSLDREEEDSDFRDSDSDTDSSSDSGEHTDLAAGDGSSIKGDSSTRNRAQKLLHFSLDKRESDEDMEVLTCRVYGLRGAVPSFHHLPRKYVKRTPDIRDKAAPGAKDRNGRSGRTHGGLQVSTIEGHSPVVRGQNGEVLDTFDADSESGAPSSESESESEGKSENESDNGEEEGANFLDPGEAHYSQADDQELRGLIEEWYADLYRQDRAMMLSICREYHINLLVDLLSLWVPCLLKLVVEIDSVALQEDDGLTPTTSSGSTREMEETLGLIAYAQSRLAGTTSLTVGASNSNSDTDHRAGSARVTSERVTTRLARSKGQSPHTVLSSLLSTITGAILAAAFGYSPGGMSLSRGGSNGGEGATLLGLPLARIESMNTAIRSFVEKLQASSDDSKDPSLLLDSFTEQVLLDPHYLVCTSRGDPSTSNAVDSPVSVGGNSSNAQTRKRSVRINESITILGSSDEVGVRAGPTRSMLLQMDSSVTTLYTEGEGVGCFSKPLPAPFLQRTLLEVASVYEEVLQLVRDCREQCDMEPLEDSVLTVDFEDAAQGEYDNTANEGDERGLDGPDATSISTARLLFSTQERASARTSRSRSNFLYRHRLSSQRIGAENESMLLHVHDTRSPLHGLLGLLQSMSYVGQRQVAEGTMVILSEKLRKLVVSHLRRWENQYDRQHVVFRQEQESRERQFRVDSQGARRSYANATTGGNRRRRGLETNRSEGTPGKQRSERPYSTASVIVTPYSQGKLGHVLARGTPITRRESDYHGMQPSLSMSRPQGDIGVSLQGVLARSGRLIKVELNGLAMKILRPSWVFHGITAGMRSALLLLLEKVASARLVPDLESCQVTHLHDKDNLEGFTAASGSTGVSGGGDDSGPRLSERGPSPAEDAPLSSPPSSHNPNVVLEDLLHSLDIGQSSAGVIDSGHTKRRMSRRVTTIMSNAPGASIDGAPASLSSKVAPNNSSPSNKRDASKISNLAIALHHVAIESVRNSGDASDNNVEVAALALAMRTKMVPKLFALVLQTFPLDSEGLGSADSSLVRPAGIGNPREMAYTGATLMERDRSSNSSESDSLSDERVQRQPFAEIDSSEQGTHEQLDNAFRLIGGRVAEADRDSPGGSRKSNPSSPLSDIRRGADGSKEIVAKLTAVLLGRGIDLPTIAMAAQEGNMSAASSQYSFLQAAACPLSYLLQCAGIGIGNDNDEEDENLRKHKQAVRASAKACALLEYQACQAYLEQRMSQVEAIIVSHFHYMAKREKELALTGVEEATATAPVTPHAGTTGESSSPSGLHQPHSIPAAGQAEDGAVGSIPAHVSRLLLFLSKEVTALLEGPLADSSIERGYKAPRNDSNQNPGSLRSPERESFSFSFALNNQGSRSPLSPHVHNRRANQRKRSSGGGRSSSVPYAKVLFAMLCRRILWLYESVIVSLHEGSFATPTSSDAIPQQWPATTARAVEEYLFLACLLPASHHHVKPEDVETPTPASSAREPEMENLGELAVRQAAAVEQRKRARVFAKFVTVALLHQSRDRERGSAKDGNRTAYPTAAELGETTRVIATSIRTMH